jgi:hypothetical protein
VISLLIQLMVLSAKESTPKYFFGQLNLCPIEPIAPADFEPDASRLEDAAGSSAGFPSAERAIASLGPTQPK